MSSFSRDFKKKRKEEKEEESSFQPASFKSSRGQKMHIKEHSRFDFMDTEDGLLGMKLYVKDVSKNFSAKVHEDLRKYAEKYADVEREYHDEFLYARTYDDDSDSSSEKRYRGVGYCSDDEDDQDNEKTVDDSHKLRDAWLNEKKIHSQSETEKKSCIKGFKLSDKDEMKMYTPPGVIEVSLDTFLGDWKELTKLTKDIGEKASSSLPSSSSSSSSSTATAATSKFSIASRFEPADSTNQPSENIVQKRDMSRHSADWNPCPLLCKRMNIHLEAPKKDVDKFHI